ncbi:MAG TPA: hypothetical protein VE267_10925 [Bradyrhizobium sp.]|nr:hypothetical protein [Bradyrhizobium sp.]
MSSGHYCIIRDLGLVKGGKGLRHHEVVLDFSWPSLVRFAKSILPQARTKISSSPGRDAPASTSELDRANRRA